MQSVQNILDQQAKLLSTQDQLSRGEKNVRPSDNPGAASRVIDLNEAISQIGQFGENASYATQRLNLQDSTLTSVNNLMQRVRELTIQAGNTGTNDLQSEQAIASELRQKLDELMNYANTKDENGDYIFSGFQSRTQAFTTDGAGNYFFNGDEGQLSIQIGSDRKVTASDSGAQIFQQIRTGNGDFSVDAVRTNAGTGRISTGSVTDRSAFLSHDYSIRFVDASNYEIVDNTLGSTVLPTPRAYTDGGVISFDGMTLDISGQLAAGDEFTVQASRNQDVFSSLYNLVRELDKPGTGDIIGSFGGNYAANNFAPGDIIGFDLNFDGQTLNVAATAGATDAATAANLAAGLVAAGVTDNGDGTYTLNGNTPGFSVTFQIDLTTNAIQFRSSGGNGEVSSNLTLSNLTDTGNDGVLTLTGNGNTVASGASITSAVAGDTAFFGPGGSSNAFVSQQIDNALNNFDQAMSRITTVQASIGGRLNSIESQQSDNEDKKLYLQGVRSDIKDLDYASAISDLTFQTTALQVAQQSYVKIQNLSLFNYL